MTPTEKGRRYDALYYGHRTTQELCEMVVAREQDVEDLQERLADSRAANDVLKERCKRFEELTQALAVRIRAMEMTADMFSMDARVIESMRDLGVPYDG